MPKYSADGHSESIVDRYMPNATLAEREKAEESLKDLAKLIARILARITHEEVDNSSRPEGLSELESESSPHHER
jgi:hypothetical protein